MDAGFKPCRQLSRTMAAIPLEWRRTNTRQFTGMAHQNQTASARDESAKSRPEFQIVPMFSIPMVDAHMHDCEALNGELASSA